MPERIGFAPLPLLEMQPLSVEHRHDAVADVGGEDVEGRLLGEFEEPPVTIEKLPVDAFEQGVRGELRGVPAGEPRRCPQRKEQREPADDPVSHVVLHEPHDLAGRLGKLRVAAGVTVPVKHEVRGQNAPAGYGGDVIDERQRAVVAEIADHAEVVERGAKAAA